MYLQIYLKVCRCIWIYAYIYIILQHKKTCCWPGTDTSHVATHCNSLPPTAIHCNSMQHSNSSPHYNSLQLTATHCNLLQLTATLQLTANQQRTTLQITATHRNSLQLTEIYCNSLINCSTSTLYNHLKHTATCTQRCSSSTHCDPRQHTATLAGTPATLTATHINRLSFLSCATTFRWGAYQHTATHCNTLQHTATHCNSYCNTHKQVVVFEPLTLMQELINRLQHTATHCNTLHHTAPHYNTP